METVHNLDFEVAPWIPLPGFPPANEFQRFRVGACDGLWASTKDSYDILAITNNSPGNGHFEDVLQWFFASCIRDKKSLKILEVWNKRLKKHLIEKRGFSAIGIDDVVISCKEIRKMNKEKEVHGSDRD